MLSKLVVFETCKRYLDLRVIAEGLVIISLEIFTYGSIDKARACLVNLGNVLGPDAPMDVRLTEALGGLRCASKCYAAVSFGTLALLS